MGKINVVLIVLNEKALEQALQSLNFNRANLCAIVIDNGNGKFLSLGQQRIPLVSFSAIQSLLDRGADFVWLISSCVNGINDIWKTKKFLMNNGVPEDNIVNFEILPHISFEWLANLRYVRENGADFFATGISYIEVGLDLRYLPHVRGRGVNLSGSNQDLRQGYLTTKHVFEHVKPGTIKFVLIGLAPYSFRYTNEKAFSVCSRNLQYTLALESSGKETLHDILLKTLVNNAIKNHFFTTSAQQADLNFDTLKNSCNRELPAKAVVAWEDELKNLTKKIFPQTVEENIQVLTDYIKLCLDNGAKPVGVVFPFAPAMRKNYDAQLLNSFRAVINQLEQNYDFTCVDMFDLNLGYDCFYNMAHLNLKGAALASSVLGLKLYERNILSEENFCGMSYDYFNVLSNLLAKDSYNALMARVFEKSVEMIRRKNKIKVGFVLYDSSMWCGDDLYNFFAADERFEPTIFLCLRTDKSTDELVQKDFLHGVEQFKTRGLNVTAIADKNFSLPAQDVLIFLTPYLEVLPRAFQADELTAKTLVTYIPYAFDTAQYDISDSPVFRVHWKLFAPSVLTLKMFDSLCKIGMPRGIYSGYPKLDSFYGKKDEFNFNWKMTRPDAKKIIYAPHWTINDGVLYATFQWNFKFMYEFAKAHPEISWVFKPHPNLFFSAVTSGLFPSTKAFQDYLHAWDTLPNAKVVTGGYYQEIFATSDGMILDSGSFNAEYQYTHKPIIFLTRETQRFNEFGNKLMNVLYRVDGRDLEGIAALMQKIFIEGNDPMFNARKKFFDEHLNYVKHNGTTASEFIFKNILTGLYGSAPDDKGDNLRNVRSFS
ncbi:MAG: CDP-glycerol glycerophosphotransferase family protein [Selenomonadaceae bacterium]|nr:CDP-glycerol glycerophosphotransferase family protein [Selenomonadaceae bacterium]